VAVNRGRPESLQFREAGADPGPEEILSACGLDTIETVLIGNVVPFRKRYERRGERRGERRAEQRGEQRGIKLGLREALDKMRTILVGKARGRFGDEAAERVSSLLEPVTSFDTLSEVGQAFGRERTCEDFFTALSNLGLEVPTGPTSPKGPTAAPRGPAVERDLSL